LLIVSYHPGSSDQVHLITHLSVPSLTGEGPIICKHVTFIGDPLLWDPITNILSLSGEIFFGGGAETPSSALPNFFRMIFGKRTKFGGGGQIRRLRGLHTPPQTNSHRRYMELI